MRALRRKLNGHIPLNLPELHNWVLTLGVHILGVHIHPGGPDNISDMLPASSRTTTEEEGKP